MPWLRVQACTGGESCTWSCSSTFRWRSALGTAQQEKHPRQPDSSNTAEGGHLSAVGCTPLGSLSSSPQWQLLAGYVGVPRADSVCSSSFAVTPFSSPSSTLTWCNAERHLSCIPRPSPLSSFLGSHFSALGCLHHLEDWSALTQVSLLPQGVTSVHAVTPLCRSSPETPGRGSGDLLLPSKGL